MDDKKSGNIPIHQSLLKPDLIAGGERFFVVPGMLVVAWCALAVSMQISWGWGLGLGVVMGMTVLSLGQFLVKRDPQLIEVWMRHLSYQKVYQSHGYPDAPKFKHRGGMK